MPHDFPILPEFTSWPTFPFEGDLRVRTVDPAVSEEPPRQGEDPATCAACLTPDSSYLWVSARWRVRSLDRPTGLPMVLILESRSHLDLGDLPNLLAAELGVMTVRLERAVRSLDGVARVHVNRWGDGSAHLHLWFLARPFGQLQLRGTFLSLWDDILPPVPEHKWRENLAYVGAWLAEFGGRTMVEAPHIDWQSPSSIDGPELEDALADDEEAAGAPDGERPTFEQRATLQAVEAPPEEQTHLPLPGAVSSGQESFIVGVTIPDEPPFAWPSDDRPSDDRPGDDRPGDGAGNEAGNAPATDGASGESEGRVSGVAGTTIGAPHRGATSPVVAGAEHDGGSEPPNGPSDGAAGNAAPSKKGAKRAAVPRKTAAPRKSTAPRKAPAKKAVAAVPPADEDVPASLDSSRPISGATVVAPLLPPDPGDPDEQWLDDDRTMRLPARGTDGEAGPTH